MTRQATLFETWNTASSVPTTKPPSNFNLNFGDRQKNLNSNFLANSNSNSNRNLIGENKNIKRKFPEGTVVDDDDDDEAFLAIALEASKIEEEIEKRKRNANVGFTNDRLSTSKTAVDNFTLDGFDADAGKIWIYPTNFPMRNYQFEIIKKALFNNTLVTLPTGLGKTFIAAVVMYNFFRWYPTGKVVFMAPTKPLVAQQVEACYNIMAIPLEDVAEMTGSILPANRKKMWNEKRVFFLTPQVINNDLQKGLFAAETVKCLVVDEAHKAMGEHAYCQVVRELLKHTKEFRVLALSATPGSDLNAVQQVLSNLLIAHMELRSEDSPEIKKYTHARNVECIVVPLTSEMAGLRGKYESVIQTWLNVLSKYRVMYAGSAQNCSLTSLLGARHQFRANRPPGISQGLVGMIEGAFTNAIGLIHGYSLLTNMGMKALYNYFQGKIGADKSTPVRRELNKNPDLKEIYDFLRERFAAEDAEKAERLRFPADDESFFDRSHAAAAFSTQQVSDLAATSHPKLVKLVEVLTDHFKKKGSHNTRVMVFAQFRDCVEEITELLKKQRPLIRPMKFVGQTSSRGTTKGVSQKEQLRVVSAFKSGGYNTLIATSVGEEGLDIGEVDLIVCYDATASPVRSVQRMGRTGRKRDGRIVVLVTEGKEQNIFTNSEYSKKRVHKAIVANRKFEMYKENRRMIPFGLTPECVQMFMWQEKRYENFALRSKQPANGGKGKCIKRFTGSLSELELNEWERDFKIRDPGIVIKSLEARTPLKMISEKKTRYMSVDAVCLDDYALWQERAQPSFFVEPSSIRNSLIKMTKTCDKLSRLPETVLSNSITRFCRPHKPSPIVAKKEIREKISNEPKKKRRRLQKKSSPSRRDEIIDFDSCQIVAHFDANDFYTTTTGRQLNLKELFSLPKAIPSTSRFKDEYKRKSDPEFEIRCLTSKELIAALKENIADGPSRPETMSPDFQIVDQGLY